jgi:hypothetical protein
VWYSSWPDLFSWRQGRDAPFSPRRSMQEEDAYVNSDDAFFANTPDVAHRPRFVLPPKSVSLAGGIRYIDHRVDVATGRAAITRAELYADVFSCTLVTPEYQPNASIDCDWAHSYPLANMSIPPPYAPTGSLPLPVAYGASSGTWTTDYNSLVRWGGASSSAALTAWLSTTPTGAADASNSIDWSQAPSNVSVITQPLFMNGISAGFFADRSALNTGDDVVAGRYHPAASLDAGRGGAQQRHLGLRSGQRCRADASAAIPAQQAAAARHQLHLQQMVQTPEEATDFIPQAASASTQLDPPSASPCGVAATRSSRRWTRRTSRLVRAAHCTATSGSAAWRRLSVADGPVVPLAARPAVGGIDPVCAWQLGADSR